MKVVMLHSALGDSRLWKRQVAALSGEHEVVTPDLPGWGETPLPTESFSFVDAVAEHLPAALVGNSFGGAVALRTALAKQELISRLVLIAPGLPTWDWSEEMRTYWAAEEAAWDAGDFDLATEVNLDFWVKPEHQDEVRPQQRRAIELQSAHEEPEVTWPEPAPLETLAIPTLVVVGDDDKADFRAIAKHLVEHVPGSELAVVAGRRPSRRRRPAGRAQRAPAFLPVRLGHAQGQSLDKADRDTPRDSPSTRPIQTRPGTVPQQGRSRHAQGQSLD